MLVKFGYYSKPIKHNPKGRIISTNTNAAYNVNLELLKNRYDPGGQIDWLEKELQQLEDDDGFAYIIGHIPPADYMYEFHVRYRALMERYQHIIRY